MNRRHFLGFVAPAAIGALVVPELLIAKRTFFLPPAGGWRTNVWGIRFPAGGPPEYSLVGESSPEMVVPRAFYDSLQLPYSYHSRAAKPSLSVITLTIRGNSG